MSNEFCRFGRVCETHGFIHGMEAEELRERLEALETELLQRYEEDEIVALREAAEWVRAILDEVDARDSVAALEVRLELDATLMEVGGEPPDILLHCDKPPKSGRLRLKTDEENARRLAAHLYQGIHVVAQGGRLLSWAVFETEDGGEEG